MVENFFIIKVDSDLNSSKHASLNTWKIKKHIIKYV